MAEFCDVMKQAKRMCEAHEACYKYPLKDHTAMCAGNKSLSCIASKCDVSELERIVMAWAEKHPGPRYPTWKEWQKANFPNAGTNLCPMAFGITNMSACIDISCGECTNKPIPADIAKKLGIKPIGGDGNG